MTTVHAHMTATIPPTSRPTIPYPALFLRCRAIAFGLITFTCLLWLVLLCTVSFIEWDFSDRPKKALLLMLLVTNTVTILILPVLIIREFRPWLDAVRFLLLCMLDIGTAALFTYWAPKSPCPPHSAGSMGRCEVFNLVSIITAWVVCTLLIAYVGGLILMGHYRRKIVRNVKRVQFANSSTTHLIKERDIEAAPPTTPASSFYPATPTTMRPYSRMPTPRSVNFPQPVVVKSAPRQSMRATISPSNAFLGDVPPPHFHPRPRSQSHGQSGSRKSAMVEPVDRRISTGSRARVSRVPVPPLHTVIAEQRKTLFMDSKDTRFNNGANDGRFQPKISRISNQSSVRKY